MTPFEVDTFIYIFTCVYFKKTLDKPNQNQNHVEAKSFKSWQQLNKKERVDVYLEQQMEKGSSVQW